MTREELLQIYKERIRLYQEAIHRQTRRISLLSLARLAVLVALVWFLVAGIRDQQLLFYLLSLGMLFFFLSLVSLFNRHQGKRELLRQLLVLNEKELACLNHDFHHLPDGSEYADTLHPWSHDLDLFGKGSLYQYLSRTATREGSRILAGMLTTEPSSAREILERQKIVEDLKQRIDFRQTYTASGQLVQENAGDLPDLSRWLNSSAYISKHRWLFFVALGVSLLSVSLIIWGIFDSSRFWFLLYLVLLNLLLLSPFFARTQKYQQDISRKHELLEGYAGLLKQMALNSFKHPELLSRSHKAGKGMREVSRLSRLMHIFDQRLNMLLGSVLNGLFLFDFIMLHLLERWKNKNRKEILEWIGITGWMDAMTSLAGFAWNHPAYVLPVIEDSLENMKFQGLGHPLIADTKRVNNDLIISSEKVVVITGANMAGKSTFLRSTGVNMVLCYTGCPVCASEFRSGFMGLRSSMRTADSLKDEESYFLAEIRKLQGIVQEMESGKPMLILLDEVLKGTNTTDKKLGSVGLIKKALKYPVRCLIATHDLSLGELEKIHGGEVVNYCFESYIKEMELSFDYTIRKGIATNMNASFLMKKMGIVD
ncbi:MAG: hypothetical protein P1P86_05495 [Bacteroidales bacterium]|nr:hypothetical protein [Bacteroidales bacterium]